MEEDLEQIVEQSEETEEAKQEESEISIELATVQSVESDGLTLLIDGSDSSTTKHYKANTGVLFKAGDRVKVIKESGSYIVEYPFGTPNSNLIIPSGGTSGQILTKDGSDDYSVKWASGTNPLPTGGSAGQVLTKKTASNYDVQWSTVSTETDTLKSGSYTVQLSSTLLKPSSASTIDLGSSTYPFGDLYVNGSIELGTNAYSARLGFFGTSPVSRQYVASSATVATLITALKSYGLIY